MKKADFGKVISLLIMLIGGIILVASKKKSETPRRAPFFLKFLFVFVFVLFVILFAYVFLTFGDEGEYLHGIIAVRDGEVERIKPKKSLPYVYKKPITNSFDASDEEVIDDYSNSYPPAWHCDSCGRCRDIFGNEWQSQFDPNLCK